MSPTGLFPPMKDPACPFLLQTMESKDVFWAPCQYTPSRSSPFAMPHYLRFLPSAVLHPWMCSCYHPYKLLIFLPPASAVSMCSCSLPFDYYYTLRPELSLDNGKALHQILCKNLLNPTQVLRKCSCQTPGHTAAARLQQKRQF